MKNKTTPIKRTWLRNKSVTKKSKYLRILSITTLTLLFLLIFCYAQNNYIVTTKIAYKNDKIPNNFNGYKIAHISDLHNKQFGKNQSYLLKKIQKEKPDMIVITGDLIDSNHTDIKVAMEFIKGAVTIAPVYYTTGNHEYWSGKYAELSDQLQKAGVDILDDSSVRIEKSNEYIYLLGLSDPAFTTSDYLDNNTTYQNYQKIETLQNLLTTKEESLYILLSHRPELFPIYKDQPVDLVFSGHAHGGQFRLPFIGGLVAPNQGLFPKYTSGSYVEDNTTMIVSRGLGNSIVPLRLFNQPEVIIVTLSQ